MESEWLRNNAEVDFIGVFYRILQAPFREERISVRFDHLKRRPDSHGLYA